MWTLYALYSIVAPHAMLCSMTKVIVEHGTNGTWYLHVSCVIHSCQTKNATPSELCSSGRVSTLWHFTTGVHSVCIVSIVCMYSAGVWHCQAPSNQGRCTWRQSKDPAGATSGKLSHVSSEEVDAGPGLWAVKVDINPVLFMSLFGHALFNYNPPKRSREVWWFFELMGITLEH